MDERGRAVALAAQARDGYTQSHELTKTAQVASWLEQHRER
jgi:hypothetical protein